MNTPMIPISTLFMGLNGLLAFVLSYMVVMERVRARVWHGESKEDVVMQPNPLTHPTKWVSTVESMSQKLSTNKVIDEGILQRKVRAHGNFIEYVPLGLLFITALELTGAQTGLVWFLCVTLTIARIIYAYGVITKYGLSVGRAIGFFGTWFVYVVGSLGCVYYGFTSINF